MFLGLIVFMSDPDQAANPIAALVNSDRLCGGPTPNRPALDQLP